MVHLLRLLTLIVTQVALQQRCDAQDIPVVVSTVYRVTSEMWDIAVDRNNDLLYVTGAYSVNRLTSNGANAQVIAGSSTTPGTADGVGGAARFNNVYGITCDTVNNIAYICETYTGNYRIRTLNLTNNNVTTLPKTSVSFYYFLIKVLIIILVFYPPKI